MPDKEEIVVTARRADIDEAAIAAHLRDPYVGRRFRVRLYLGFVGVLIGGGTIPHLGLGGDMISAPAVATLYLVMAATYGAMYFSGRRNSAVQAIVAASPIRQMPIRHVLSARGVGRNGALSPWEPIVGIATPPGVTVLPISPPEGFSIPGTGLPPDVTPDALRAAVSRWLAG